MLGVKQSSTTVTNPVHVDLSNEKRKVLSNKDVRTRQTGKKGNTNSAYFEESSAHINIAPNRVPFGTLNNLLNTNGARNSLPLQTTSPQNLSGNKENITPLQTPRSNGSTSLCTNKLSEANANIESPTPVGAIQYLSGMTSEMSKDDRHGSNILSPLFDQEYNQTADGTNVGVDQATQKRKEYQRNYWNQRKLKKVADADANMKANTMEGMTQNLLDLTRENNIDDRHGSSVPVPLFDQEFNQNMAGTNVGEDPTIQKKKQYDKEYQRLYYQQRKQKKLAEANANIEPQTPVGATQYLSGLTSEISKDDRHGSNILLPLFDQEYNQTADGTNVGVDQATQKRKEYQRNYWHQRKLKKVADADANMEADTMEGMTQNLSDLTRENNIDDRHGSSVLVPLFDQEFNQNMAGTNVGEDPTIQKKKQYDKEYQRLYYQQRKQKKLADANANMEADTMEGMTQNLSDLTRETTIDDPYNFVYDGLPKEHRALKEQPPCVHCGAKKIQYEFPTFCCMSGKTTLKALEIPPELYNLFTSQCELGKMFRKNIRAYNTNFSFASMGVKLDKTYNVRSSGVYTFRVNGGIYHRMDQLVPRDGQPRYLQLYFYDAESELEHRLQWPNLDKEILKIISRVLAPNPYVQTFRTLGNLGPLDKYRVELNASVKVDQRLYNRPTTSEVAGIWVEGNNNITAYKRSIVVYAKSEHPTQIQPYYASYDPLSYPMFFPNGEAGWHSRIPREGVTIVTYSICFPYTTFFTSLHRD
ncbi:hypothetical protein CTI12_AA515050 [Artemisia annua]|uniref:Helitron helicase-like domain-containing protein n=1 Tax=Artemisia annua TaxID=35608 RepID=A0A2U1L8H0_ARTAN|nr:hypothetical protein CTI12_AA515050 [Artemisia annua]